MQHSSQDETHFLSQAGGFDVLGTILRVVGGVFSSIPRGIYAVFVAAGTLLFCSLSSIGMFSASPAENGARPLMAKNGKQKKVEKKYLPYTSARRPFKPAAGVWS